MPSKIVNDWYARILPYPLIKYKSLKIRESIEKELATNVNYGDIADAET